VLCSIARVLTAFGLMLNAAEAEAQDNRLLPHIGILN
jgi:hypothetical protein